MLRSAFFNSIDGDRKYDAKRFAEYFASFIGNGIFPDASNALQVMSNNDMTVTIKAGKAWINGYIAINDSDYILQIEPADGVLNRIDRVVLRYDEADREIRAEVKKGELASSPVAKELQRDADAYELGIADIAVNKGATSIKQDDIIDLRDNEESCGWVDSLISGDVETLKQNFIEHTNKKAEQYSFGHIRLADVVIPARRILAGTGLSGGGDLSQDRTLSVDFGTSYNTVARGSHGHSGYLPNAINFGQVEYSLDGREERQISINVGYDCSMMILRSGETVVFCNFATGGYFTWYAGIDGDREFGYLPTVGLNRGEYRGYYKVLSKSGSYVTLYLDNSDSDPTTMEVVWGVW